MKYNLLKSVSAGCLVVVCNGAEWNWITSVQLTCRDGSTTGIGVREGTENALMIYLQGGGACYDQTSCDENTNSPLSGAKWTEQNFENWRNTLGNQGVFNTQNPANPVALWTHVYVPYCSGDLHGGLRSGVVIEGVPGSQTFMGSMNMRTVTDYLHSNYGGAGDVALVGASAGGFGVLLNYERVALKFGSVVGIVDSAPIIPEFAGIRTSCFQQTLLETFNLQLPPGCPQCADPSQEGLINLYNFLADKFPRPRGRFGFLSEDADSFGSNLYDIQSKKCGGVGVNIISYRQALIKLRDAYIGYKWSTFLPGGILHTMTQSDELFFNRKFQGSSAAQWLGRINEDPPVHIPEANLGGGGPPVFLCFSKNTRVHVQGKGSITMDQLRVGDYVQTSQNQYSMVYSFGHYDTTISATFLQIHTTQGLKDALEVSDQHMVYVLSGRLVKLIPAGSIQVGDLLLTKDGTTARVVEIKQVQRMGVFAPYTTTGRLAVNGVIASNYVAVNLPLYWEQQHLLQHALNMPRRLYCPLALESCQQETYVDGLSTLVLPQRALAVRMTNWHVLIQAVVLLIAAVPLCILLVFERFIASWKIVQVWLLCITIWLFRRRCSAIGSFQRSLTTLKLRRKNRGAK